MFLLQKQMRFFSSGPQVSAICALPRRRRPRRVLRRRVRPPVDVVPPHQVLLHPPVVRFRYGIRLGPVADHHVEAIHGVDGRSRLHSDVLRGPHQREVEFVYDHGHCHRSLQHRELIPNALPLPCPEGEESVVTGDLVRVQHETVLFLRIISLPPLDPRVLERPFPSRGVVLLGRLPVLRSAVEVPRRDEDVRPAEDLDPARHAGPSGGQRVLLAGAADEDGGFRVQAQRLDEGGTHFLHLDYVVVVGTGFVAHDRPDLRLDFLHHARIAGGESEQRPREHRRRRLVPGNEHCHQIVPQHLARQVLPSHVRQKPQQARIVSHVPLLQLLHGRLLPRLDRLVDEFGQYRIEHAHVLPEFHLSSHPLLGVREVPVWYERRAPVLGLAQHPVHGLDYGALLGHRAEVVVEDGLPDDVQRDGAESLLHVDGGLGDRAVVEV
mmetsp:Transcript_44646/g.95013  ORF Transcript_44646/g.95013 Transcript_44646/m.95013 type:complete len:437 (-) Transcript_44646:1361-2671(-)